MIRAEVEPAIAGVCAAEPAVVAAYLFGSLVRDAAGPLSDIDVGLLVREGEDREVVCGRVMDALSRRLRTSDLEVVSLADAPLPLRYRVVRDGILVLGRDAAALERFVAQTVLRYLDFKPLRDRAFASVRGAILGQR